MRTGKLFLIGSFAVLGVALTSCSKTDVFDSNAEIEKQKDDYASTFVKKYGEIDPNQSWDFCTMAPSYSLESSSRALTRDGDANVNADAVEGKMLVEKATIDWMSANMKAGDNNVQKGKPFFLQVPENSFTIVPIFQGTASYYWQLWMHVDGIADDKLIWSKGDIEYITSETDVDWKSPGTGNAGMNNAYQIKSPTFEFSNLPREAEMYFYLKVWNSYDDFKDNAKNPRKLTSLEQMMLALIDCPRPVNVPEGNEVSIIGCEDNKTGDYDYEDLVFMMYGNPAPPIQHVDEVIVGKTKRYMMEDLGSTPYDFDFNDIVVDVTTERVKKKIYYDIAANGSWTFNHEEIIEDLPQEAIVRAAGGTVDFTLTIGTTTWTKSAKFPNYQEMLNTGWQGSAISYGAELDKFTVEGWDPTTNNITVTVAGKSNEGVGEKTIGFPARGESPMIIAIDATTDWMKERVAAPAGAVRPRQHGRHTVGAALYHRRYPRRRAGNPAVAATGGRGAGRAAAAGAGVRPVPEPGGHAGDTERLEYLPLKNGWGRSCHRFKKITCKPGGDVVYSFSLWVMMTGSRAASCRESCQGRKAAAISGS